jgi:hypothetical protein
LERIKNFSSAVELEVLGPETRQHPTLTDSLTARLS